jgi:hypothetical protein
MTTAITFDAIPHSVGHPLGTEELNQLWSHYGMPLHISWRYANCALSTDGDGNNTLDAKELKGLMTDMFDVARVSSTL